MSYCIVNFDEMRNFLKEENGWEIVELPRTFEYVFQYKLRSNPNIVIRVFSSIHKLNNLSRKKGDDAIRVCAFNIGMHRGLVKSFRILRVDNWRYNLKKRILYVIDLAKARIRKQNKVFI